jgi:Tfp pilus assembly ATPase PilU
MERDQASKFINDLLKLLVARGGSDLFLTAEFPPAMKVDGKITKVSPQPLTSQHTMSPSSSAPRSATSRSRPVGWGAFGSMPLCSRVRSAWCCA